MGDTSPQDQMQSRQSRASPSIPNSRSVSKAQSKKYVCKYEGCTKAFTRSDHLQRHSLNHTAGQSTCPRCSVHFNRPDLLERHLARHKQKDEEAGGYGLGIMETRKRMWRDAEGNIVSKRPALSKDNPVIASSQGQPYSNSYPESYDTDSMHQYSGPLSPPVSMSSGSSLQNPQQQQQPTMNNMDDYWSSELVPPPHNGSSDMCDFLTNSSWGSQPFATAPSIDDNIFNPDTASSFNMPFTTMNNYNWLFNIDGIESYIPLSVNPSLPQNPSPALFSSRPPDLSGIDGNLDTSWISEMPASNESSHMFHQEGYKTSSHVKSTTLDPVIQPSTPSTSISTSPDSIRSKLLTPVDISSSERHGDHLQTTLTGSNATYEFQPWARQQQAAIRQQQVAASDPVRTFSRNMGIKKLPVVDELTRHHILDLVIQASPKTPEGSPITRDHPLLSLSCLQNYSDLFFCRFNITYPLLHQATFEPSQVEPLLLISVLLLGATYGDKAGHGLAVCIHDVLRAQIFQNAAFKAQPDLWILQTILLVECFGKSRAGQTQHDMSHLFHGLLINLIRRSNCQTVQQPSSQDDTDDLEVDWRRFIDIEHRKRLALLCFLWDTQHAVLFSQSLCMSAFELRVCLPCDPVTWEAESADQWHNHFKVERQTSFLSVLKTYVNLGFATPPPSINALSRLLILHGLMSLSWDMKRREQTSLGFAGPAASDRQNRLAESYDKWKVDFDTYCMSMALHMKDNAILKKEFTQFSTSCIAIFHAAHITLNVEILDLQIYAGARHIIGRPVTRPDYDRSRRILKQWVKPDGSQEAVKASWHAAHLLRDGIMNLDGWDVNEAFHYPWCLYLATLTCWAFHFASRDLNDQDSGATDAGQNDDIVWDAQAEMNALVSGMTSVIPENLWKMAGKYPSSGLTAVMGKHLSSVRWAVVHEGMKVLRGLVAERRINEYDSLLR